MHIKGRHENGDLYAAFMQALLLFHVFDRYYFAIGGSNYLIFILQRDDFGASKKL